MGREATITFEQVAAAANAMKVDNIKPTSRAVRERLGNTGSMGTVNKLLQEWKNSQERQIANALTLPASLQRAILEFMGQELASAKAALESDLADQQREVFDLATENERQAVDIEDRIEAYSILHAEASTMQGRLIQMDAELAGAKTDAVREREAAEAARIDLAKAQLRLEAMPRLETDLVALRVEVETERNDRVAAEKHAAVLAAKLEAATNLAASAEAAAKEAAKQADDSRATAAKLADATDRANKAEAFAAEVVAKASQQEKKLMKGSGRAARQVHR